MRIYRRLCEFVLFLFIALAFSYPSTEYGLSRLGYDNGVDLFGVSSRASFYFPKSAVPPDSNLSVRLRYAYTELAGPKTMVTFLVNEQPVAVKILPDRTGDILIELPPDRISVLQDMTFSVLTVLDYSECDHKPVAKESLWFSIRPETSFSFSGVPERAETITDFLNGGGLTSSIKLIVQEYSLPTLKSLSQVGLLLGYLSKSLKKEVSLSSAPQEDSQSVLFQSGNALSLTGRTLIVGNDAAGLLSSDTLPLLVFRSVENPSLGQESPAAKTVTFGALGWSGQPVEVVYSSERRLGFTADLFGGVPQSAVLSLDVSAAHFEEEEAITVAVFLNERLVGTVALDTRAFRKTIDLPLAPEYFRSYNQLRFEMKKYRGECKSVSLAIQSDSLIHWESVEPVPEIRLYDFPYFLYGKTGILLSSASAEWAEVLLAVMLKKGEGSHRTLAPEVFLMEEMKTKAELLMKCDSYLFLAEEAEVYRIFPAFQVKDGLRITHPRAGTLLFSPEKGASYAILISGLYEGKPALLCSVHGESSLLRGISEEQWRRIRQSPGNLALLTEKGQVVSFEIGQGLSIGEETAVQDRKPDLTRILLILAVVVVAVFFLISSYRKTSSNR